MASTPTDPADRAQSGVQDAPTGDRSERLDELEGLATIKMYSDLTGITVETPSPDVASLETSPLPIDENWIPVGDPVIATGEDYNPDE